MVCTIWSTMPRARFATADQALRERILAAAKDEFAAKGYEAASLNRILLQSGLSKGSFYYYFDDKLDLATTVFLEAAAPMANIGEIRDPSTVEEFWAELHRMSFERLRDIDVKRADTEVVLRLAHAMLERPQLQQAVLPMMAEATQKISAFLERGVALGAIRADLPVPVLMRLLQDLKASLFKSMYPEDHVLTDDELRSFTDLVLDMARRTCSPKGS